MSSTITYEDIKNFGLSYSYNSHAKKAVSGISEITPEKKTFKLLIKRTSRSAPKVKSK